MDPLIGAASRGEWHILNEAYAYDTVEWSSYLQHRSSETLTGNFIHVAVKKNHFQFLYEAFKILPPEVIFTLVCQVDKVEGSNPLHYAARDANIFTLKLLINAYVSSAAALANQCSPPWLTKNNSGSTPLHICFKGKIKKSHEFVAKYLVSRDHHLLRALGEQKYPRSIDQSSTMSVDQKGASIFFLAMREGFSLLAEQILTSGLPYSLSGTYGENPLHYASRCGEKLSRLLLERHPELIEKMPGFGGTMLDRAVEDNAAWLVKLMLIGDDNGTIGYHPRPWDRMCRRLIWHTNPGSSGDTPLHIAARKGYIDIVHLLIQGYQSAVRDESEVLDVVESQLAYEYLGVSPLRIQNSKHDIPLFVALKKKHDDLGAYLLSLDNILDLERLRDGDGNNAYWIAIENDCELSRKMILERTVRHHAKDLLDWDSNAYKIHPSVRKILGHVSSEYAVMSEMLTSEDIVKLVWEGLPMFLKEPRKDANLLLEEAAERGADWLVKVLLRGDSSLINESTSAWETACRKGHLSTLLVFLEHCDRQEFIKLCQNNQQTPLHHITSLQYEQYTVLLAHPVMQELKNQLDCEGATPLHIAINHRDFGLTKALLADKDVKLSIEDRNHKTALELLEEKYIIDDNFFQLYKELLANPLKMQELKNMVDSKGTTLLHGAIKRSDHEVTKALLEIKGIKLDIEDLKHKTALDLLEDRCITSDESFELYKRLLANPLMTRGLKNRADDTGATPLHRAIMQNVRKLVNALINTKGVEFKIKDNNGKTAFDLLEERCSIITADGYWYKLYKNLMANPRRLSRMINLTGVTGDTPLHVAIEWDDPIWAKTLMKNKGIKLDIKNSIGKTALRLIEERCAHIDSPWYKLYRELLVNPDNIGKLKNRKGANGMTPLHRAVMLGDIRLAKTLLETTGVELNIQDKNDKTALDLLDERYSSQKWGELCRELRLDPIFNFKYLQQRTSLKDMNNTLSIVAALLATITFAAGFTIPGGVDSNDGTATLGTKAAFLAFSITNTIAMCSSMLVLFTVIGAMIWEARPNDTFLIDLCVFLLQLSLCGTIVAFMTGVYAIMAPKVLWAGIVVMILCSLAFCGALFAISSSWPIIYRPFKRLKKRVSGHSYSGSSAGNQANGEEHISSNDYNEQPGTINTEQMGVFSDSQASMENTV